MAEEITHPGFGEAAAESAKVAERVVSDDRALCRVALLGVLLLTLWALAHSLNLIGTYDWSTRPALAATPPAITYTCGAPDDMGFSKCRRQSP